ncbi:MAG: hypothetical protein ABIW82_17965 [Dokdonella sp.]
MNHLNRHSANGVAKACLSGLLLASTSASAATWCVHTAADFRAKLALAESNGESDIIQLVRGTYAVAGDEFTFTSTEAFDLVINGDFDPTCTKTGHDPHATILDGGGLTQVLRTDSSGGVTVRYVTVQNGFRSGSDGGGMQMNGTGAATLALNIFRNNASDFSVGAGYVGVGGDVRISGNLIVGNHAPGVGGFYVFLGASALADLTNNTIVGNSVTNPASGTIMFFNYSVGTLPAVFASNNIFWGNTTHSDLEFLDGLAQLHNNDYSSIMGSPDSGSAANQSIDPMFAAAHDFHLKPASPLLGAGTVSPHGGLNNNDIEGHDRTFNGLVDMGAYERGDKIFDDGFEP